MPQEERNLSRIRRENYIYIAGWMVTDLKLSGNELLTYGIVYGFSQNGESRFEGSLQYIADFINASRDTARRCLRSLEEKGFIEKDTKIINGVTFNSYCAGLSILQPVANCNWGGSKMPPPPVANCNGVGSKMQGGGIAKCHPILSLDNKVDSKVDNNTDIIGAAPENFSGVEAGNQIPKQPAASQKEKKVAPKKEKGTVPADAVRIIDHLNATAGKSFKPVASNTGFISARLKEGYSEQELREVIELKTFQWKDDPKMREYLRPETLFNSTKFAGYVQAVATAKSTPNYATQYHQSSNNRSQPATGGNINLDSAFDKIDRMYGNPVPKGS